MRKKAMEGLTFGCDPELFVLDSDGNAVCADGLIPGTKLEPYKVDGGAVQVDGMAAEFNIDPVTTYEEFNLNVNKVMGQLRKMLPKGYTLAAVPSMQFSEKVWEEAPLHAKVLGCTPDYNAWDGTVNPPPDGDLIPRTRTASGHLHIGWTDGASLEDEHYIEACRSLVKQLDWYLGAWSLEVDKDTIRRHLYGKSGAMRFKPYGVEYRVLSNFWLTSGQRKAQMWDRLQAAIWDMSMNYFPERGEGSIPGFRFTNVNKMLRESIDNSLPITPRLKEYFPRPLLRVS